MTAPVASDEAYNLYPALLDKVTDYGIAQHDVALPRLGCDNDRLTRIKAANQVYREVIDLAVQLRNLAEKGA